MPSSLEIRAATAPTSLLDSQDKIDDVIKSLDQKIKDDVQFYYDRVRKFAEHQLKHFNNNF